MSNNTKSLRTRLNNLKVKQKLWLISGSYSVFLCILIALSWEGMWILSDVRTFISGKTLWAGAHRQASIALTNYALFHSEKDYDRYYEAMKIVYGDRIAFAALLNEDPDIDETVRGWIIGGVEPYDALRGARTYLRFKWFPLMQEAMDAYVKADEQLRPLDTLAEELKERLKSKALSDFEKHEIIQRITSIIDRTSVYEREFDDKFGEMARVLIRVLSISMALFGAILILAGFLIARYIARSLVGSLEDLRLAAKGIAMGDFTTRIDTESKDEVGDLARQFSAMARARKNAENDLERRAQELSNAYAKIAESEKLKSEFLATVSHELRTPLTLILTPIESLLNREEPLSEEKLELTLQIMHNNSIRLLQMITGLLDFSKIEAGKLNIQMESIDIVQLTEAILNDFYPTFKHKNLKCSLDFNSKPIIEMDRYIYERILFNLLSNACKFTPENGTVLVKMRMDGDLLTLSVIDSGIGIADADQVYLFEKFRQVEGASTRRFEGAGLGLNLVKDFAEALGGGVSVSSKVGEGSSFTVTLKTKILDGYTPNAMTTVESKVQQYKAVRKPSPQSIKDGHPKARILVAEDNPELADYISGVVESIAQVRIAKNGKIALELISDWRPDLVISDVMMPEMDGFDLTKAVKGDKTTNHIPIILLTAQTHRDALMKGWEAGADEYLFKPFHHKELTTRVKSVLELSIARRKELLNSKLASLGEMAGGIAHEINNPLAVIQGHAMRIQKVLTQNEKVDLDKIRLSSQKILDVVNRISRIIKGLRDFARDGSEDSKALTCLMEPVKTAIELVENQFEAGRVKLVLEENNHPIQVAVSETQFVQVLVNMLNNAFHAAVGSDEKWVKVKLGCDKDYAFIMIEDSGIGIPNNVVERVFDPFFTSKEVGKGTGLGLSISKTIIENHGGELSIDSQNNPTRFKLQIPLSTKNTDM